MIAGLVLLALLGGVPTAVTVSSAGGETVLPVRQDRLGAPVLAAPQLLAALGGSMKLGDSWADVTVSRQAFRFLLGAPLSRRGLSASERESCVSSSSSVKIVGTGRRDACHA